MIDHVCMICSVIKARFTPGHTVLNELMLLAAFICLPTVCFTVCTEFCPRKKKNLQKTLLADL